MKTYNHTYTNTPALLKELAADKADLNAPNILVQIFCGELDIKKVDQMRQEIAQAIPQAVIIGATTAGEISSDKIYEESIQLSVSIFNDTKITAHSVVCKDGSESFAAGQEIAQAIVVPETKAMIVFSDGNISKAEDIMKGISSLAPDVVVAGGMAGDNFEFAGKSLLIDTRQVLPNGCVAVALNNPNLIVNTDHSFDWHHVGKQLAVTKIEGNVIHELDHEPVVKVYEHYLGKEIADALPETGVQFPLITTRNGIKIARAVLSKNDDGSLVLAGDLHPGERVQFGYANTNMILGATEIIYKRLSKYPTEAIFVYSCCARRIFMGKMIRRETAPLHQLGPLSGFFTYGEFFHGDHANELLNETMTVLSLSEASEREVPAPPPPKGNNQTDRIIRSLNALTRLTHVVTDELTQTQIHLEEKVDQQTRELRESYEQLKTLDHSKDEFIAIGSHELRTPMTVIRGYISILLGDKKSTLDAKQRSFLQKMYDNTNKLLELVNDMLDISKIDSKTEGSQVVPIKLKEFIQNMQDDMQALFDRKQIDFTVDIEPEIIVLADQKSLSRVLTNLLNNASKFTKVNGSVQLKAHQEGHHIVISIRDNGVGIPADMHQKVFERFTQADNHLQREAEGTGLGLSICKMLIERMHGRIWLESEVGKGSCFSFALPADEQGAAEIKQG